MSYLAQILMNGVITGGEYALASLGFALIFGVLRVVNFAHGATCVVGGFTGYLAVSKLGLPLPLALPCAMLAGAAVGLVIERLAFRPFRGEEALRSLVSSLACAIIIENALAAWFGSDVRSFRSAVGVPSRYAMLGATITSAQMQILLVSAALVGFVYAYLKLTNIGRQTIAISDDPEAAASWGIPGDRVIVITFMLSSGLAGAAGFLIANDLDVDPFMGTELLFGAFTANLLFGIGSLPGAVAGALTLGIIQNMVAAFLSSRYKSAYTFLILICVLLWRPHGVINLTPRRFD